MQCSITPFEKLMSNQILEIFLTIKGICLLLNTVLQWTLSRDSGFIYPAQNML
jgi:hypothetical protein